jgi:aspartate/tyrosine/aromatic aminotransferase
MQNPTGIDPTEAQWKELSEIVKEKKHFPFFDMVRVASLRVPSLISS